MTNINYIFNGILQIFKLIFILLLGLATRIKSYDRIRNCINHESLICAAGEYCRNQSEMVAQK